MVFPTAGGYAHEWQHHGMLDALGPMVRDGFIKLYCPEHNAVETWRGEGPPSERLARHLAYERFVQHDLLHFIEADCNTAAIRVGVAGASLGAAYAMTLALKRPDRVAWTLGLSGRYLLRTFLPVDGPEAVSADPMRLVEALDDDAVAAMRSPIALVCGTGAYEGRCIEETVAMARALGRRGIPAQLDLWGSDVSHGWHWWARQAAHHIPRLEAAR